MHLLTPRDIIPQIRISVRAGHTRKSRCFDTFRTLTPVSNVTLDWEYSMFCSDLQRDSKECFPFVVDTHACQNTVICPRNWETFIAFHCDWGPVVVIHRCKLSLISFSDGRVSVCAGNNRLVDDSLLTSHDNTWQNFLAGWIGKWQ